MSRASGEPSWQCLSEILKESDRPVWGGTDGHTFVTFVTMLNPIDK